MAVKRTTSPDIGLLESQFNQMNLAQVQGAIKLPSYAEFESHPLFMHTKESHDVYERLTEVIQNEGFTHNYTRFLDALLQEDWYSYCENYFLEFSYLSIIAFFNQQIDEEQLCCIHTVAEAYRELQNGTIASLEVHVLSRENRGANTDFLKKVNQPPFAKIKKEPIVGSIKTQPELDLIQQELLDHISQIESAVARSVLVYGVRYNEGYSIEYGGYKFTNLRERYIKSTENKVDVVLFPHDLGVKLNTSIALQPLPRGLKNEWMFGYAEDVRSILEKGVRPASVASPLFETPYAHGYTLGPKGLGLQMHDENYHMPLDLNIPMIMKQRFSELSQKILALPIPLKSKIEQKAWENKLKKCSNFILDREIAAYRLETNPQRVSLSAFFGSCLMEIKHYEHPYWYNRVFFPLIKEVVYKKSPGELMPTLKHNISMQLFVKSEDWIKIGDFKKAREAARAILDRKIKSKAFEILVMKSLEVGAIKEALKVLKIADPLDRIRIYSQLKKIVSK
ncbi:MAG: hypothetical protein WCG10_01975 [Chlamydiota bacterium]